MVRPKRSGLDVHVFKRGCSLIIKIAFSVSKPIRLRWTEVALKYLKFLSYFCFVYVKKGLLSCPKQYIVELDCFSNTQLTHSPIPHFLHS